MNYEQMIRELQCLRTVLLARMMVCKRLYDWDGVDYLDMQLCEVGYRIEDLIDEEALMSTDYYGAYMQSMLHTDAPEWDAVTWQPTGVGRNYNNLVDVGLRNGRNWHTHRNDLYKR